MVEDIIKSVLSSSRPAKSEGITLEVPSEAKYVGFDDKTVRLWQKPKRSAKPTDEWVTGDFASYARWLHYRRYNRDWDLNFRAACVEALRVRDNIVDTYGFCDNTVFRDFIDFFFDTFADSFMGRSKRFLFVQMSNDNVLTRFAEEYDYRERIGPSSPESKPFKQRTEEKEISESLVRETYLLSPQRAVAEFGVVVMVNFEHVCQGLSPRDAARSVYSECMAANSRPNSQLLDQIKQSTESMGPYPKWLPFLAGDKLLKKVDDSIKVSIALCDDDNRFLFLQRK